MKRFLLNFLLIWIGCALGVSLFLSASWALRDDFDFARTFASLIIVINPIGFFGALVATTLVSLFGEEK